MQTKVKGCELKFSEPKFIPVSQVRIGDTFIGPNCTIRAVKINTVENSDANHKIVGYNIAFKSITQIGAKGLNIIGIYTPDTVLPLVLGVIEALTMQAALIREDLNVPT